MGILKSQLPGTKLGLNGVRPETREHSLPTSQLHAQNRNPSTMQPGHSIYDLDGKTPDKREGALPTSQLHAQGINPTSMKAGHSIFDNDGGIGPRGKYVDNAPESGISDRIVDLT